jgi:two-component system alkaline phosphatase synthesis response regulator PhoP
MRILVVEDEMSIQKMIAYDLEQANFQVVQAMDGQSGYNLASSESFDLVLLDVMLPKMNGIDTCKKLREESNQVPIILLTALDDEFDKITGLNAGADDYITKPFSPRELVARIKAVLRRQRQSNVPKAEVEYHGLVLYPSKYKVFYNDEQIDFTLKEFELLEYFIRNKGIGLSREQLLSNLWGFSYDGDSRIVDVHVFKLRDKLAETNIKIKTIRGIGYLLEE